MEIKFSSNRQQASVFLGIFVLVTFIVFMFLFITISVRAKKLRPRQLPPEDTNAVNHLQIEWFANIPPTHQDAPPAGIRLQSGSQQFSHTNYVFLTPGMETNGWLFILRSEDLAQWTALYYVMFGEPFPTNTITTNALAEVWTNEWMAIKFVDQYALPEKAFYRWLIKTNAP